MPDAYNLNRDAMKRVAETVRAVEGMKKDLRMASTRRAASSSSVPRLVKIVSRTASTGNIGTYTVQPISPSDESDVGNEVTGVKIYDGGDATGIAADVVVIMFSGPELWAHPYTLWTP